jgi:hypothetical protein
MPKKTRKRLKYPILQTVQPELMAQQMTQEKLAKSIQSKNKKIEELRKKLRQLEHEVGMQTLAYLTHVRNEKEFNKKLNKINKQADVISKKNALLKQMDSTTMEAIKETFIESMRRSIANAPKQQRENKDD